MGLTELESVTSCVSSRRSNQLSYRPYQRNCYYDTEASMRQFLGLFYFAFFALPLPAVEGIEVGDINGAKFRIDMPEKWNGSLVIYCHGYSAAPGYFNDSKPNPVMSVFLNEGFAVAQSGYAAGGWAIQEAMNDTEALRRYFVKKHGAAKETYVTGHSMGGFLTMALMESFPNVYDGGLPLCGPLAAANWFMERRVFDMLAIFEYLFPGALPSPGKVPETYMMQPQLNAQIEKLLDGKPGPAAALLRWSGIHNNNELSATLVFFTYILKDLAQRGGGNSFDNTNTIYDGTGIDNEVNDGVKRYRADQAAVDQLARFYTPTGRLSHPMLAIHTTYDPLVPPWTPNMYAMIAAQAGKSAFFSQRYVKHDGHCAIMPAEISKGFADLRHWKATGKLEGAVK